MSNGPFQGRMQPKSQYLLYPEKCDEIPWTGIINHKLTLCSFSISVTAIKKIISAGGKVITIEELVNKYPDGNGVRIIG